MVAENKFRGGEVPSTVGTYLARRMIDIGVKDYFVVPGDFNLILLDEILRFPEDLRLVSCCNELNAAYAADGYARANGCAVIMVTYTVGSLSAINAIAGAYSADLPVVIIAGGPNNLDYGSDRIVHHTTGEANRTQEIRCMETVTCKALEVLHPWNAPSQIDLAFATAMKEKKPVFLSMACNIVRAPVPMPIPFALEGIRKSNPASLKAAIASVVAQWDKAVNPVLITGVKTKPCKALEAVVELSTAAGCATAIMPDAKGLFPESHPNFIGTIWGPASSPNVAAVVDNADMQIYVGPIFNDVGTAGYSALFKWNNIVVVSKDRVRTPTGDFGCVYMAEFISALAKVIKPNDVTMRTTRRLRTLDSIPTYIPNAPGSMLTTRNIDRQ
eukprot:Ihof_evm11s40 gene=Ihof_evmTU11s40